MFPKTLTQKVKRFIFLILINNACIFLFFPQVAQSKYYPNYQMTYQTGIKIQLQNNNKNLLFVSPYNQIIGITYAIQVNSTQANLKLINQTYEFYFKIFNDKGEFICQCKHQGFPRVLGWVKRHGPLTYSPSYNQTYLWQGSCSKLNTWNNSIQMNGQGGFGKSNDTQFFVINMGNRLLEYNVQTSKLQRQYFYNSTDMFPNAPIIYSQEQQIIYALYWPVMTSRQSKISAFNRTTGQIQFQLKQQKVYPVIKLKNSNDFIISNSQDSFFYRVSVKEVEKKYTTKKLFDRMDFNRYKTFFMYYDVCTSKDFFVVVMQKSTDKVKQNGLLFAYDTVNGNQIQFEEFDFVPEGFGCRDDYLFILDQKGTVRVYQYKRQEQQEQDWFWQYFPVVGGAVGLFIFIIVFTKFMLLKKSKKADRLLDSQFSISNQQQYFQQYNFDIDNGRRRNMIKNINFSQDNNKDSLLFQSKYIEDRQQFQQNSDELKAEIKKIVSDRIKIEKQKRYAERQNRVLVREDRIYQQEREQEKVIAQPEYEGQENQQEQHDDDIWMQKNKNRQKQQSLYNYPQKRQIEQHDEDNRPQRQINFDDPYKMQYTKDNYIYNSHQNLILQSSKTTSEQVKAIKQHVKQIMPSKQILEQTQQLYLKQKKQLQHKEQQHQQFRQRSNQIIEQQIINEDNSITATTIISNEIDNKL